MVDFYRATLC